jgi:inosine-uridine nucleoside N-ribohydrolase
MFDSKIKILLDTDIGVDCDDAGAIAILHTLADKGEAQILGMTHCYSGKYNAGCISAINTYYGRPDIPIGVCHKAKEIHDIYARHLAENFTNRYRNNEECEDAVALTRRLLWESADHDVTYVAIGSLYSLRSVLESEADGICPLSGEELLKQKLKRTVIMGGRFKESWPEDYVLGNNYVVDAEFNIKADIAASQIVCERFPGEIVFCSYEIGWDIITGEGMLKSELHHPVKSAYKKYTGGARGRESWDLTAILYAVRPEAGYWSLHEFGKVTVDDAGVTTWTKDEKSRHTYLLVREEPDKIREILDNMLETIPKLSAEAGDK